MCATQHVNAGLGVLKTFIPSSAFLHCSDQKKPFNTLFHQLNDHCNVGLEDLERCLGLVLALFEKSPEGRFCFFVC